MNRDTADTIEHMSNVTKLPTRHWYEIRNVTDETADIFIYDQIGEDWWTGEGITSKAFISDLNGIKAARINLHVNSPGGSVFDGLAIANALQRHPAHVTTYIDGLAASIASIIALAGDHIVMAKNSMFMIHNPSGGVQGDATDMRKMADVLDKIRDTLVNAYVARTNASRDDIVAALEAETWYSADEALEAGFVDEVSSAIKAAASFDLSRFPFRHAPLNMTAEETLHGCGSETCGNCDCAPITDEFKNVLDMETFVQLVTAEGEVEYGRIEHVMTEGVLGIPGSQFSIEATPENPAALVRIWDEEDGVWFETEKLIARTFDALTEIEPLTQQQTEEPNDPGEDGASEPAISVGATEPRKTEAFVEGLGFIKL